MVQLVIAFVQLMPSFRSLLRTLSCSRLTTHAPKAAGATSAWRSILSITNMLSLRVFAVVMMVFEFSIIYKRNNSS